MGKIFAAILIPLGLLIMLTSGLCTVFVLFGAQPLLIIGLPIGLSLLALGYGILHIGWNLWDNDKNPPS